MGGVAGARTTSAAIETSQLTRDFGRVRAVGGLTLEVPTGTIFGFLGPNGAGKTTTILLLLGLLEPSVGHARVLGRDPWRQGDEVRREVGALLEDAGLYPQLSAAENLEFYARIAGVPAVERDPRIARALRRAGLEERRDDPVGGFSRGMQRRLALARALLHDPALVFLDEPTAGLDVLAATAVRDDLAALAARGTTVFLTTHDMAEAERLCDRVAVIRAGRLVAVGPLAELRQGRGVTLDVRGRGFGPVLVDTLEARPEVAEVATVAGGLTLRLAAPASSAPLVRLLVDGGAEIEEVRRRHSSLEEVFITLVRERSDAPEVAA